MKSMSVLPVSFAFARRWSDSYVETGTYKGGSLCAAADADFRRLYTCDANRDFMQRAHKNMRRWGAVVHYHVGDSPQMLPLMLDEAGCRCAILLDAHGIRKERDSFAVVDPFPLPRELAVLRREYRCDHLIMVDDIDQCGTPKMGNIARSDVEAALKAINPEYTFRLFDGVRPEMLLVAVPPGYPDK